MNRPLWSTHPWLCLAAWTLIVAVLSAFGLSLGLNTILPGPTSKEAILRSPGEKLAYESGIPPKDIVFFVLSHESLNSSESAFKAGAESLWEHLRSLQSPQDQSKIFERVQTAGHTWLDESLFVSQDSRHLLLIADSTASLDTAPKSLETLPEQVQRWQNSHPAFSVSYLSNGTSDNEIFSLINRDLDRSLIYTLPATLLILVWSFGSFLAASIPLVIALMSLAASLALAAIISAIFGPVSATAAQLVVLLVLAVGIDYSLFMISRFREEYAHGRSLLEAIASSRRSAGTMVMWSGLTVACSLVGLLAMNDTILTSMGIVSIVAVLVTVASTLWALPPMLHCLGKNLTQGGLFRRKKTRPALNLIARFSTQYPLLAFTLGLVLLLVPALACSRLKLGTTIEGANFPHTMQANRAYGKLVQHFPTLAGSSFSMVLSGTRLPELEDSGDLEARLDDVRAITPFEGPTRIDRSEDASVSRYHFIAPGSANDDANRSLILAIRENISKQLFLSHAVDVTSGGILTFAVDEASRYRNRSGLVIGVVLGVSLVILLFAFRSIVLPLHAIVLNLFSTAASFGGLVIFFQLSGIPAWNYGVIESFVPPLLFSILFGLSIDYHVFVVSRIQEEFQAGNAMSLAVERGLSHTFRTITCAAFIMVSVFIIIAMLELPVMKQLGVGLAVAILLDATVVRSILLPSSLVLLGEKCWYLPRFLSWIPNAHVK